MQSRLKVSSGYPQRICGSISIWKFGAEISFHFLHQDIKATCQATPGTESCGSLARCGV